MHKNPKSCEFTQTWSGSSPMELQATATVLYSRVSVANLSAACYQRGAWLLGPAWLVCLGPVCGLQAALHSRWSPATGETSRCSANVAH